MKKKASWLGPDEHGTGYSRPAQGYVTFTNERQKKRSKERKHSLTKSKGRKVVQALTSNFWARRGRALLFAVLFDVLFSHGRGRCWPSFVAINVIGAFSGLRLSVLFAWMCEKRWRRRSLSASSISHFLSDSLRLLPFLVWEHSRLAQWLGVSFRPTPFYYLVFPRNAESYVRYFPQSSKEGLPCAGGRGHETESVLTQRTSDAETLRFKRAFKATGLCILHVVLSDEKCWGETGIFSPFVWETCVIFPSPYHPFSWQQCLLLRIYDTQDMFWGKCFIYT